MKAETLTADDFRTSQATEKTKYQEGSGKLPFA